MKNIVTVKRLKDGATRVYGLPEGVQLEAGTLVQFTFQGAQAFGRTTQDSLEIEDNLLGYMTDRPLVNIEATFAETTLAYPAGDDEEAEN